MASLNGEVATDGDLYFHVHDPPPYLIEAYDLLLAAASTFRRAAARHKDPVARLDEETRASVVDLVIKTVSDGCHVIAKEAAAASEVAMIDRLEATQHRPNEGHLITALRARAIPTRLGTLEVGVGEFRTLDAVARDYWRVQEVGSTHLVGKVFYGKFTGPGGTSYPSPQRSGMDIRFLPGKGRRMTIRKPIPARHYLAAGVAVAERMIHREFATVESTAIAELDLVVKGTHPRIAAARRVVARRIP